MPVWKKVGIYTENVIFFLLCWVRKVSSQRENRRRIACLKVRGRKGLTRPRTRIHTRRV